MFMFWFGTPLHDMFYTSCFQGVTNGQPYTAYRSPLDTHWKRQVRIYVVSPQQKYVCLSKFVCVSLLLFSSQRMSEMHSLVHLSLPKTPKREICTKCTSPSQTGGSGCPLPCLLQGR